MGNVQNGELNDKSIYESADEEVLPVDKRTSMLRSCTFRGYGSDNTKCENNRLTLEYDDGGTVSDGGGRRLSLHKLDQDNDTVSSLCLRYDIPKHALIDLNTTLLKDDEQMFHVESVYVPVDQTNCNHIKLSHVGYKEMFSQVNISDWEKRKKIHREERDHPILHEEQLTPEGEYLPSYEDEYVLCNEDGLTIKNYYWPKGEHRSIKYENITNVQGTKINTLKGTFTIGGDVFVERFCYPHPEVTIGFMIYESSKKIGTFVIAWDANLFKQTLLRRMLYKHAHVKK
ncbi:hypothetical protein AKO1_004566 [Acrasis kona]|uniref:Uncharacterized protein n=1 Tax=Acrasis kona TaxID=1008807 RepID=A0AAW2Z335_9EUKA